MKEVITYYGDLLGYVASAVVLLTAAVALFMRWRDRMESTYFQANGFNRFDHRRARQRYIPHTLVPHPELNGCELLQEPIRFDELLEQFDRDDRQFPGIVLVKGGTGTGKTTLLLRIHQSYFNVFRRPLEVLFPIRMGRRVVTFRLNSTVHLETIAQMNRDRDSVKDTILLLDGLDELQLEQGLPFTERFDHVRSITDNFKGVVITCRSQDMSRDQLKLTSDLEYDHLVSLTDPSERRHRRDAREVGVVELRPFTDKEINAYLDRAFPWYRFKGKARKRAEDLLAAGNKTSHRLGVPMVLAFLKEIVYHPDFEKNKFSTALLVGQITHRWMEREAEKASGAADRPAFINMLRTSSEAMGYAHVQRDAQERNGHPQQRTAAPGPAGWRTKVKHHSLLDRIYGQAPGEPEKWVFAHRIFRDYFAACYVKAQWDRGERLKAIERDFYHAPDAEAFLTELNIHKPLPTMPVSHVEDGPFSWGPTERERQMVLAPEYREIYPEQVEEMERCVPQVVHVDGFLMAKATVTMRQFRAFVKAVGYDQSSSILAGSKVWMGEFDEMDTGIITLDHDDNVDAMWGMHFSNGAVRAQPNGPEEDHPVLHVSLLDMVSYCNWLSREAQLTEAYSVVDHYIHVDLHASGYRLPTAIEWEYAAREGRHRSEHLFSGSDIPDLVANFFPRFGLEPGFTYFDMLAAEVNTLPVRSLMPNKLDIYDLSGNVAEMVWGVLDGFADWGHPIVPDQIGLESNMAVKAADFKYAMCSKGGSVRYVVTIGQYEPKSNSAHDTLGFRVMRPVNARAAEVRS